VEVTLVLVLLVLAAMEELVMASRRLLRPMQAVAVAVRIMFRRTRLVRVVLAVAVPGQTTSPPLPAVSRTRVAVAVVRLRNRPLVRSLAVKVVRGSWCLGMWWRNG